MEEEKNKQSTDHIIEKHRLVSHWSHHFLEALDLKIEKALIVVELDMDS